MYMHINYAQMHIKHMCTYNGSTPPTHHPTQTQRHHATHTNSLRVSTIHNYSYVNLHYSKPDGARHCASKCVVEYPSERL